jgi:hypothetical protein
MKKILGGVVMAAALVAVANRAEAQSSASGNINATATVTGALTATPVAALDFGFVVPGTPKAVATSDATAGVMQFNGTAGAQVNVTFTSLPANLSDGTNDLSIGSYTAATAATQAGAQTSFAPAGGTLVNLSGAGEIFVFVGATVSPLAAQPAGAYSGTITVQAAYTGN